MDISKKVKNSSQNRSNYFQILYLTTYLHLVQTYNCFTVMHFIVLHRCYIFYKLKTRASTAKRIQISIL